MVGVIISLAFLGLLIGFILVLAIHIFLNGLWTKKFIEKYLDKGEENGN